MILCAKWVRSSLFLHSKISKRRRKNCPQLNLRIYVKFDHRPRTSCTYSDFLLDFENKNNYAKIYINLPYSVLRTYKDTYPPTPKKSGPRTCALFLIGADSIFWPICLLQINFWTVKITMPLFRCPRRCAVGDVPVRGSAIWALSDFSGTFFFVFNSYLNINKVGLRHNFQLWLKKLLQIIANHNESVNLQKAWKKVNFVRAVHLKFRIPMAWRLNNNNIA